MKDIVWVNTVRAFGIFLVYLYHCEFYFGVNTYQMSKWYIPFFMAIFFFVSGYLFFFPNKIINIKAKLKSLLNKQLWPYFVFCSIIYIPKILFRGGTLSFGEFASEVLTGSASWFIAALIVLQIIVLIFWNIIRSPIAWGGVSLILSIMMMFFDNEGGQSFWYWKSSVAALPFFALGGIFHYYEEYLMKYINFFSGLLFLILYIIILVFFDAYVNIGQAVCNQYILGLVNSILGTLAVISLFYRMPKTQIYTFIGQNTLPFYFVSGGCPLVVTSLAKKYIEIQTPLINIVFALSSLLLAVFITLIIKNNFKFMLDFSVIAKHKCR